MSFTHLTLAQLAYNLDVTWCLEKRRFSLTAVGIAVCIAVGAHAYTVDQSSASSVLLCRSYHGGCTMPLERSPPR